MDNFLMKNSTPSIQWPLRICSWLIGCNMDASKKVFVATAILLLDFELFIGGRLNCHERMSIFQETCVGN